MIEGKIEILKGLVAGHFYKIKITDTIDEGFEEVNMEYLGKNEYGDNCFLSKKRIKIVEFSSNCIVTEDEDVRYEILDNSVYKYWKVEQEGNSERLKLTVQYPEVTLSTTIEIDHYIKELDKRRIGK